MSGHTNEEGSQNPSPESIKFAAQLKAWRLSKNMTQKELADAAGVSKSAISIAERALNQFPPKEITQNKIAAALGISMHELRDADPGPSFHVMTNPRWQASAGDTKGICRVAKSEHSQRDMSELHLPMQWIRGYADDESVLRYYPVNDKSMQPTIDHGDIAILEPVSRVLPGLYLVGVTDGDDVRAVGIRRVSSQPSGIKISCDNSRYDDATEDDHVLMAHVLLVIRSAFVPD